MELKRVSIPVNFDLSQLKIRWSDHLLVKEKEKILGEAVVYGGDWEKAGRLARQISERTFEREREILPVCEQIFISPITSYKLLITDIAKRKSNLKVKVGRDVHDDIRRLTYICRALKFRNAIRIDANQGYSMKQLRYLLPTLLQCGVHYLEEPVRRSDLPGTVKLLHENGLEIILDETIQTRSDWEWVIKNKLIDVLNLKIARVGDLDEAFWYIKQAKKYGVKIVIGCSEELERGMETIYALGHTAKKEGVLLEVEGFGPLRLQKNINAKKWFYKPFKPFLVIARSLRRGNLPSDSGSLNSNMRLPRSFHSLAMTFETGSIPRFFNRIENAWLMLSHRMRQEVFGVWWSTMRVGIYVIKETKKFSALSLRLVQWTGKHKEKIHPKHLVAAHLAPWYMSYFKQSDVVLDIGCGNGQHALRVARRTSSITGFDLDERQLAIAKRMAAAQGITNARFERRSAEEPFLYQSKSFNAILFFAVLEHLEHRDQILDEIHRVLKLGGLLLLGVPNEWTSWKITQRRFGIPHYTDPDHKVEYSKESITEELVRHHFRVKSIDPTAYDTPWAGFIDLVGGVSLSIYERLLKWKWAMAKKHPQDSISWNIVAEKLR